MYRLTLVIPTYNRAASLLRALDSVARQTLDPACWECLIIDNASTDNTAEAVRMFAAEHPALHIRLVREERQGVAHARNRALQEATTELICSIDDDERINEGFLAAYLDFFERHPEAMVAGGRIIAEYESGRPRWMSRWTERPIANPMDYGDTIRPFPAGALPGGGNMGFRRSAALQFGFATELGRVGGKLIGGEENDFLLRMREAGHTLWYLPDAVMWHIIPPEKCTDEYLNRLAYHIGISQRRRAVMRGNLLRAQVAEAAKWVATLLLTLCMRPIKSRRVVRMRYEISRGLFGIDS
jgi:glycosyltransferase involved in cell wall biosynthesis